VQVLEAEAWSLTEQPVTFRTLPGRFELIRSVPWSSVATTVIVIVSPGAKLGLLAATCETPGRSSADVDVPDENIANAAIPTASRDDRKRRRRGIVVPLSNHPA
jgi:hypothetical protein